jgi:DNA processing protein
MNRNLPEWAFAGALASLPLQTPTRLRRLLLTDTPSSVWSAIANGARLIPGIDDELWISWASMDANFVEQVAEQCLSLGVHVVWRGDVQYPVALLADPHAPAVLFARGNLDAFRARRVGIIGTRTATQRGRFIARELGRDLACSGVSVVSGLARGIDVESHIGVFMTSPYVPPIAVVASGVHHVYPPEHSEIWERISIDGLLVSEVPPTTAPETHRFPLRNRILAALSEVLVVVESHARGGSMSTVREAMKRDITVMAVPGSPGVASCEGTNNLLRDGCGPVVDVKDVLLALGLDTRRNGQSFDVRRAPVGDERRFLEIIGRTPRPLDEIALLAGCSVVDAAIVLGRLEESGWVDFRDGWWDALVV